MLVRRLICSLSGLKQPRRFTTWRSAPVAFPQLGIYGLGFFLSCYTWYQDNKVEAEDTTDEVNIVPMGENVDTSYPDSFSIVQFNILAGNLALPKYFPYVEPEKLEWEGRRALIVQNAIAHDPDIICMEELNDYWKYFKEEFHSRGYESIYLKRPSLHVSSRSGREKTDGCGIFYRTSKFKLEEHIEINFPDTHDRIALAVLLKNKVTGKHTIVASTHLYWDPHQVAVQIKELDELDHCLFQAKTKWEKKYQLTNIPVVIGGDFNNTPSSVLYKHMKKRFGSTHRTPFASAFHSYPGDGHVDAPHTSCTHRRCYTIDFLWYSSNSLRVTHLGEIPTEEVLRSEEGPAGWKPQDNEAPRGIPNSKFGSDHIPLFAVFTRLSNE